MSRSSKCAVAGVLLLAAAAVSAQSCPAGTSRLNRQDIGSQIIGKTMCANSGGDRWQEYHDANGDLVDYKRGPSDRVDPSQKVGTWSYAGFGPNTLLVHTYSPSATYSWAVCGTPGIPPDNRPGAPYTLVSSQATITGVTVRRDQTSC